MCVCYKPNFQLFHREEGYQLNMLNLLRQQILSMFENSSFQKLGIFSVLNEQHDSRVVNIFYFPLCAAYLLQQN